MKKIMLMMMVFGMFMTGVAWAEVYVCEDVSKPEVQRRLQWFFRDPALVRPDYCRQVPDADVASQLDLIALVGRLDYLKMVIFDQIFGEAIEKSQVEKDAVDAEIARLAAERAALVAERTNDNLCAELTLTGINNRITVVAGLIHSDIDAASTLAQLKQAARDSFDRVLVLVQRNYRCDLANRVAR